MPSPNTPHAFITKWLTAQRATQEQGAAAPSNDDDTENGDAVVG